MSPEALDPIRDIVPGLLFRIGQSRKHPRGRFPSNFAFGVETPHGVTGFFEFPKNLGQELGFGASWLMIFYPLALVSQR
jgi:hypothetical protein